MTIIRKPDISVIEELAPAFRGSNSAAEALEILADLMADPGADHTAGELARMGAAFKKAGETLTDAARQWAQDLGTRGDADVLFTYRAPYTQQRLNTGYLKDKFPQVNYPEFYVAAEVKGGTVIDLPFRS